MTEINTHMLTISGFKKVFPDEQDKEYFYYQKDLKHSMLKGLHIIIDTDIKLWCTDIDTKQDALIYECKKTIPNLHRIQNTFDTDLLKSLVALHDAVVEGKEFDVDKQNRTIKLK